MSQHKKICLITNRYPAHPDDVASPFVRDFHLGLKEKGLDVSVFTPFYQAERVEHTEEVVRFRWKGGEKVVGSLSLFNPKELCQLFSFLKNGRDQLLHHLSRIRPDICLALWALPSGWFACQAKKKLGIPYSVWCLGSDIYVWARRPILRGIIRGVLHEAECLFADGFDLKERAEKLSGKSCLFLPSMRNLPQVSEGNRETDWRRFNFLYVGRWDKSKGVEDLIRAFASVKNRLTSAHLDIVGWGGSERKLRELIGELKLEDTLNLAGKVSVDLLARYLKAADCLVIPSRGDSIPLVFSEALQMGTPLIVTDVGDMGHLVRRFELGKVVPPGDGKRLAVAMIEFVSEKKDYSRNIPQALKLLNIESAVEAYLSTVGFRERSHTPAAHTLSR